MTTDEWDRALLWRFRARPLRVIDGDTFVAECDTGFYGRHEAHLRIADLNAPELNAPGGIEARLKLSAALTWMSGWPLRVATRQRETVVSETMSFARYVADVYVMAAGGELVNVREVM